MDDLISPLSCVPDGLYESDVDALITEFFQANEIAADRNAAAGHVAVDQHVRRLGRQVINAAMPARSAQPTSSDKGGKVA